MRQEQPSVFVIAAFATSCDRGVVQILEQV